VTDDPIAKIDRAYRSYLALQRGSEHGSRWAYTREARRAWGAIADAKARAIQAFAALNGWKEDDRGACHPEGIGHRNRRHLDTDTWWACDRLFDHCLAFRANGKNAAVVTQPYHYDRPDEARRWAAERGLAIHVPPDPLASIYYPGSAYFIVIVTAGDRVSWLPDQDGRLADRWEAEVA
jgi:hypothetical protein